MQAYTQPWVAYNLFVITCVAMTLAGRSLERLDLSGNTMLVDNQP